jgi:hypothetical protein
MDNWSDEFILPEIYDNIICLGSPDRHEREGYTVSLQTGNYENDLYAVQDAIFDTDSHEPLISSSVYTDINGERQDPSARIIDTLRDVVAANGCGTGGATAGDTANGPDSRTGCILTIFYVVRGQSALINS